MVIDPSKPYVYLGVSGLPSGAYLAVYAVRPPGVGEAEPQLDDVFGQDDDIDLDAEQVVKVIGDDGELSYAGFTVRLAVQPDSSGIVEVTFRREQDKPSLGAASLGDWDVAETAKLDCGEAEDLVVTAVVELTSEAGGDGGSDG